MAKPYTLMTEAELYSWLTRGREPLQIPLAQLRAETHPDLLPSGLLFLDFLETQGLAQKVRDAYRIPDPRRARSFLNLTEPAMVEVALPVFGRPQGGDAVVGLPISLQPALAQLAAAMPGQRVWHLPQLFAALIEAAQTELCLVLPFLEEDGLEPLKEALMALGARHVPVRLLGRGLAVPDPNVHQYQFQKRRQAFARLGAYYLAGGGRRSRMAVRDFSRTVEEGEVLRWERIHQKLLVADAQLAYLGSGEVRQAAYRNNGEAGVVLEGAPVAFWQQYFELFWQEAAPVDWSEWH